METKTKLKLLEPLKIKPYVTNAYLYAIYTAIKVYTRQISLVVIMISDNAFILFFLNYFLVMFHL